MEKLIVNERPVSPMTHVTNRCLSRKISLRLHINRVNTSTVLRRISRRISEVDLNKNIEYISPF